MRARPTDTLPESESDGSSTDQLDFGTAGDSERETIGVQKDEETKEFESALNTV